MHRGNVIYKEFPYNGNCESLWLGPHYLTKLPPQTKTSETSCRPFRRWSAPIDASDLWNGVFSFQKKVFEKFYDTEFIFHYSGARLIRTVNAWQNRANYPSMWIILAYFSLRFCQLLCTGQLCELSRRCEFRVAMAQEKQNLVINFSRQGKHREFRHNTGKIGQHRKFSKFP